MRKLKNEKGITLVALIITVAVLSIISIPVLVNMTNINQFERYTQFKDDIDILRESISIAYYNKDIKDIKDIGPKYESLNFLEGTQNGIDIKNKNDNNVYYVININKVNENLSVKMHELNNGSGNKTIDSNTSNYTGSDDVYIINEQSKTIYYPRGVTYNDETYYRLNENFSVTELGVTPGVEVTEINRFYTDIYGAKAMIPVGYKVSKNANEQIVSKGLVISDRDENEFVWIPVQEFSNEKDEKISIDFDRKAYEGQSSNGVTEGSSLKITNGNSGGNYFYETKDNFEALSVIENKGFYIGRYETGTTESSRTSSSNISTSPSIKSGLNIYNYVKKSEALSLAEGFAKDNKNLKSRLCSSYAWDTALKFIGQTLGSINSSSGTSESKTGTGSSLNNIYDLNVFQWTTESYSDTSKPFTKRGSTSSVSTRTSSADVGDANTGFRIALFLSV